MTWRPGRWPALLVAGTLMVAGCGSPPFRDGVLRDPSVLASGLVAPVDLVLTKDGAYWLSRWPLRPGTPQQQGALRFVALPDTGVGSEILVRDLREPVALAVDAARVYWLDQDQLGTPRLMAAGLDGKDIRALAWLKDAPVPGTRLIKVDGTLYWGAASGVVAFPVAGGHATTVAPASATAAGARLVAADASGLYWTDVGPSAAPGLHDAALDGSGAVLVTGVAAPAYAEDGAHVFWFAPVDAGHVALFQAPVGGGNATRASSDLAGSAPDELAADAGDVYFGAPAPDAAVDRVDGDAFTRLTPMSMFSVRLLHAAATRVYWVDGTPDQYTADLHGLTR